MINVTVVFTNGNVIGFVAQEFNVNLASDRGSLNKYTYKDSGGNDSSIHLKPAEVAGVFTTPVDDVVVIKVPPLS